MINSLSSPSVCVIDEDPEDYKPILNALLRMGVGCVHVPGDSYENLPPEPFKGLRLVFADLHLTNGPVGKASASHTANVFAKVVSVDSLPSIVVIWSKYRNDIAEDVYLPPEDQPREADLFKQTLLESFPEYKNMLLFVEMPKPKPEERSGAEEWTEDLRRNIQEVLDGLNAFEVLWSWEALVREAGINVSGEISKIVLSSIPQDSPEQQIVQLNEGLKLVMRFLAQVQGGPDCTVTTAPRHLLTALSQLAQDDLELSTSLKNWDSHGAWLAQEIDTESRKNKRPTKLNSLLLTSGIGGTSALFAPGTVYEILEYEPIETLTGYSIKRLREECFSKNPAGSVFEEFCRVAKPVLLEIDPACDFHQGNCRSATLIMGLLCPSSFHDKVQSKDAFKKTPIFEDRFSDPVSDVCIVLCSRYRLTLRNNESPNWLNARLRLRDILMADIRNWGASQSARVGFLSF